MVMRANLNCTKRKRVQDVKKQFRPKVVSLVEELALIPHNVLVIIATLLMEYAKEELTRNHVHPILIVMQASTVINLSSTLTYLSARFSRLHMSSVQIPVSANIICTAGMQLWVIKQESAYQCILNKMEQNLGGTLPTAVNQHTRTTE